VVLGGVEVDGVDAARVLERKGQDVIAGGGDCQNDIVGFDLEDAGVGAVIFPCEGIDVAVVEAFMFL
jgi:hypothetical protein